MILSTNFVAASACPYHAVVIYACKYRRMKQDDHSDFMISPEEEEFAKRVLQAEELFSYQENALNWQTVAVGMCLQLQNSQETSELHFSKILSPTLK